MNLRIAFLMVSFLGAYLNASEIHLHAGETSKNLENRFFKNLAKFDSVLKIESGERGTDTMDFVSDTSKLSSDIGIEDKVCYRRADFSIDFESDSMRVGYKCSGSRRPTYCRVDFSYGKGCKKVISELVNRVPGGHYRNSTLMNLHLPKFCGETRFEVPGKKSIVIDGCIKILDIKYFNLFRLIDAAKFFESVAVEINPYQIEKELKDLEAD